MFKKKEKEHKPCKTCLMAIEEVKEKEGDKYLRLMAEFDNYKKRQEKEQEKFERCTTKSIVEEFLPVIDDLEKAAKVTKDTSTKEGIEMILRKFKNALSKFNVSSFKSLGKKFDPEYHQAVHLQMGDSYEEDTVIAVINEGYMIGDVLLRPAEVVVAQRRAL